MSFNDIFFRYCFKGNSFYVFVFKYVISYNIIIYESFYTPFINNMYVTNWFLQPDLDFV